MNLIYKKLFGILTLSILGTSLSYGQGEVFNSDDFIIYVVLGLTLLVAILVLVVAFYVLHILRVITEKEARKKAEEEGTEYVPEPSWWQRMNYTVSMEDEASIDMNHSYDGIRELDNHLPPWWKYLFYITIVFSVVYIFFYHVTESLPLQQQEYETEMQAAAELKAAVQADAGDVIDENSIVFTDDPDILASGKKIYDMQCVACHKALGEGGIGPNLTDEYWIHGGSIQDIFKTVRYGVPDKGMIAWEGVLSLSQINDVSMYINTLKGTNPPNAKDAQGELYSED